MTTEGRDTNAGGQPQPLYPVKPSMTNPLMLLTKDQLAELSTFEDRFIAKADEWLAEHPDDAKEAERYCRQLLQIHPDTDLAALSMTTRDKLQREMRLWVARTEQWPDRRQWCDAMLAKYARQPSTGAPR